MAIQNRADQNSEIIRSQIRGVDRTLRPPCKLSNLCISGTDTNDRRERKSKINII
jgi:hypothetical protein